MSESLEGERYSGQMTRPEQQETLKWSCSSENPQPVHTQTSREEDRMHDMVAGLGSVLLAAAETHIADNGGPITAL